MFGFASYPDLIQAGGCGGDEMMLERLDERRVQGRQVKLNLGMDGNEAISGEEMFVGRIDGSAHSFGKVAMQIVCWITREDEEHAKVAGEITGLEMMVALACQMASCVAPEVLTNFRSPHQGSKLSWPSSTRDVDWHGLMGHGAHSLVPWVLYTLPPLEPERCLPMNSI